jgi:hypothetical protein
VTDAEIAAKVREYLRHSLRISRDDTKAVFMPEVRPLTKSEIEAAEKAEAAAAAAASSAAKSS